MKKSVKYEEEDATYSKKLQYNGGNSDVSAFYRTREDQASHMEKDQPDRQGFKYDFAGGSSASSEDGVVKDIDRLLPIANVGRIMKQILPQSAKVSKEAKETMQECVSEFISFVTGEASDKCRNEKRKTLNGDDVCSAMEVLGFDDYAQPLKRYLLRYREVEEGRAKSKIENEEEEEEYKSSNFR